MLLVWRPTPEAARAQGAGARRRAKQEAHQARYSAGQARSGRSPPFRRVRDEAYWDEAGDLLLDYFELQAGALDSETLVDGFVAWLKRSPAEFRQYIEGDDMTRATLVDWYLRVVR